MLDRMNRIYRIKEKLKKLLDIDIKTRKIEIQCELFSEISLSFL
jgi:hypothetical protein